MYIDKARFLELYKFIVIINCIYLVITHNLVISSYLHTN